MLDREVFSESQAARLLGMSPSTLHYWLQGGERSGVTYKPVIRPDPVDSRWVTWAEFVEAGWLRSYRKRSVPMKELRAFIEQLRDQMQVPYPLAHQQPLVSGKSLVLEAQQHAHLSGPYRLVDEQLMLTYAGQSFVERITWEGDVAAGWRPDPNPESTVIVRPDVRFGRPSVGGVSTATVFEQSEDGASREEIAETFSLSLADVGWALAYENARQAA